MFSALGILAIVIALLALFWNRKPATFPAGPWGIPFYGNFHQLGTEPHKTLMEMGRKYGKIFSLRFGSYNVVVLNNPKDIKDALSDPVFSGRADLKSYTDRSGGTPRGLVFNVERGWTDQRRFTLKTLRDFGFGKKSMESIVYDEINVIISHFKKYAGQPLQIDYLFNAAVLNTLWTIVTGQRYSHDDPMLQDLIRRLTSSRSQSRIIRFFPWAYELRSKLKLFFASAKEREESITKHTDFVNAAVLEHQNTFQSDAEPRDFIDVYLKEVERTTDKGSSFYGDEGLKNLTVTLLDLFHAGAETTATTLSWGFLLLAMHPEKQEKLHQEIKNVVGLSRMAGLSDRSLMPYTGAVIHEVLRYSSIIPLSVFHAARADTVFRGYNIPKGTLIIPNVYAAMHDPKIWNSPENFNPERFLSKDEKSVLNHEAFMPFSAGKRICLGMPLAQDELFLFMTNIFQRFRVKLYPKGEKFEIDYFKGSVLVPKPYNFVVQDRFEN